MKVRWINPEVREALRGTDTDAFRLAHSPGGTLDVFGDVVLCSWRDPSSRDVLLKALEERGEEFREVWHRALVPQPREGNAPVCVQGEGSGRAIAREDGLRFRIDCTAGYSVGLFPDQRENRRFMRGLRSRRVLNCFSYTCAFSVAAAREGAETVSVDLSKKALTWGRENFALNDLTTDGHRFLADDVFKVLPRLARRGEKYDVIVLDPPVFSRGAGGRVFRYEKDFGKLLLAAAECAAPGCWLLASGNLSDLTPARLETLARDVLGSRIDQVQAGKVPEDFVGSPAAVCVWLSLAD